MSTRGRPYNTAEQHQPASIRFPYQEVIWCSHLSITERRKYIRSCNDAVRKGRTPLDVYDWYQKEHAHDAYLPLDFPPQNPQWHSQLRPQEVTPGTQSTPAPNPEPTPAPALPRDTLSTPLDTFTHGLGESLPAVSDARLPRLDLERASRAPLNVFSPPPPQLHRTARPEKASNVTAPSRQPTSPRSRTPWIRTRAERATRADQASAKYQSPSKSPTTSLLSNDHLSVRVMSEAAISGEDNGVVEDLAEDDQSAPFPNRLTLSRPDTRDSGSQTPLPPISVPASEATSPQVIVPPGRTSERHSSHSSIHGSSPQSSVVIQFPDHYPPDHPVSPSGLPSSDFSDSSAHGSDERTSPPPPRFEEDVSSRSDSLDTPGAAARIRRRAREVASAALVPVRDVHRIIQTVTSFYCDCRDGVQHQIDAHHNRFSFPELRRAAGRDRCFPPRGESLPRPFDASAGAVTRADLDRLDFAQYLSTSPVADRPRSKLRLRSTTVFPSPMEENFHVTWDVDSVWIRLRELTDLVVPLELTYTAQRFLNIKSSQHVPAFSSDDFHDPHFHKTAHSVFAKLSFATCSARIYVFWPLVKQHNKTVLTDHDFGTWIDGVVMPALHTLDSCAWQDHPKSFQDARARAQHRSEVQIGGARGQADIGYTLSSRFIPLLVHTMRQIVTSADETSPLFPFRSFSFVVIVHDLKRAFNAESPRLDALVQFRRALTATFQPEYLDSTAFLDRSFADFGVEYNIRRHVAEPTTLLVRRTCLQHRFTTALLQAGGSSAVGVGEPQLYTTYSLSDAASGRVFLPIKAPAFAVLPTIKGYDLHKHTCHTHFRHDYSSPFTLPHLDLLCLTDSLLRDVHQGIRGAFHHRNVAAIQRVFTQTITRLEEALEANQHRHTGVRIEPRVSMRHLFGLLDQEDWPSTFDTSTLHPGRHHPYVFAVATADLNGFIRNYLHRMTIALAAQQFTLFGPVPSWNSIVVRHRLGTTAVLLKIMATFFIGDQRIHYNLKAGQYESKKGSRGWLANEDGSVDLGVEALSRLRPSVRVGLMMEDTIQRYGCYWLPDQLFDFSPRPQLKLHLVTRVTLARPRLLGQSRIEWSTPMLSRRAYEGDAVAEIILLAARRLKDLPVLPDEDANYLQYQVRRMRAWVILRPVIRLLAQAFFRYIASLTDKDPFFLPLEDNEFGVPFNALTYETVTRLLGTEPILATPRASKKEHGKADWSSRVRYMFDDTSTDQWQKTASHLVELRRWIRIFKEEQVSNCYIDLWRQDMGLLMRPYIWILPSYEKKTLFRMDRFDGQAQVDKRLRTRWHLPGVVVEYREPMMARVPLGSRGRRFQPTPGNLPMVIRVCERQRKDLNPATLSGRTIQAIGNINVRDKKARGQLIEQLIDTFDDFSQPSIEWFHDKINHSSHEAGYWVPFWACGEAFPADEMLAIEQTVEEHRASLKPDGGFYSFVEAAENELNDVLGNDA